MSTNEFKNQIKDILADVSKTGSRKMPVVWQLSVLSVFLLSVFYFGAGPFLLEGKDGIFDKQNASVAEVEDQQGEQSEHEGDPFADLGIVAQMAIVFDVRDDKVLYSKDADAKWPLASVTKLMTALLAREIVPEKSLIQINADAVAQAGDSGLRVGERFLYENLSDLVLLTSSNDGAYALAHHAGGFLDRNDPATAFVKAMNVRAKELGLKDTYFRNPTGLDITEGESGAYGSALDVAVLMQYILINHPELLEETTKISGVVYNENGESHNTENTNRVVDSIPGLIGSKTGYTELSGGNLAVSFDVGVNHLVVIVVLGSTYQGRFTDVLQLVEATRDKLGNE